MTTKLTITQTTVSVGKLATIDIIVEDKKVRIEVPLEVKAYFNEQFSRPNPTPLQKKRYGTLMTLLRAAYLAGRAAN